MKYIIEERKKIVIPASLARGKRRRVIKQKGSYYQRSIFGGAGTCWGEATTAHRFESKESATEFASKNLGKKPEDFKIQKTFI